MNALTLASGVCITVAAATAGCATGHRSTRPEDRTVPPVLRIRWGLVVTCGPGPHDFVIREDPPPPRGLYPRPLRWFVAALETAGACGAFAADVPSGVSETELASGWNVEWVRAVASNLTFQADAAGGCTCREGRADVAEGSIRLVTRPRAPRR
ncbi:MAG: hypothetical protein FJ087_18540 [Deltaproteobacteria bacterium]|nr:hypothetical protein [Deltaproteobacteria bacterium]